MRFCNRRGEKRWWKKMIILTIYQDLGNLISRFWEDIMLLLGISSESLDFKYFYEYPFKAGKNRSFHKRIINFWKGDFNQCSLSSQIMTFGKLAWTDHYPKDAETKILEFVSLDCYCCCYCCTICALCILFIPNNFEP